MAPRHVFRSRQAVGSYNGLLQDVLGAPGTRVPEPLALVWAHAIAWAPQVGSGLVEMDQLRAAAERYGVPLAAVLRERESQQAAPPVVPAGRADPQLDAPSRLERPA